jgi:tRNA pseudouridine38-40 synthase
LVPGPERDSESRESGIARFWAQVEYDGTNLAGFQLQAQERTVQGEIERALGEVTGVETRVTGAGRTDSGVHARGQIIAFEVEWRHALPDLHRALNAVLPADVAILHMGVAPQGFHPRFDALSRTYQYKVLTQPWRSPLDRHIAWHLPYQLDMERMAQASHCLVGTHDFSTFGRPPQGENAVRTVSEAEWRESGRFLVFDITANAFLYHMVRSIVGSLVQVGLGQLSPEQFERILAARDSSQVAAPGYRMAPAHGLCLMHVDYGIKELCSEDVYCQNRGN